MVEAKHREAGEEEDATEQCVFRGTEQIARRKDSENSQDSPECTARDGNGGREEKKYENPLLRTTRVIFHAMLV